MWTWSEHTGKTERMVFVANNGLWGDLRLFNLKHFHGGSMPQFPSRCVLHTHWMCPCCAHITWSSLLHHWYCEENSQIYHHPSFHSQFHQASLRIKVLAKTLVCSLMHMNTTSYGPSVCYYPIQSSSPHNSIRLHKRKYYRTIKRDVVMACQMSKGGYKSNDKYTKPHHPYIFTHV